MSASSFKYLEQFFTVIGGISALWALYSYAKQAFFKKITWKMALKAAERLLVQVEGNAWRPDVVIGLGRSGALWGGWLAGNLGSLPIAVIDRKFVTKGKIRAIELAEGQKFIRLLKNIYGETAKVLVVEGAATSGQPFLIFHELVRANWPECDVRSAALYSNKSTPVKIDYVAYPGLDPYPEKFPWHGREAYRPHLGHK